MRLFIVIEEIRTKVVHVPMDESWIIDSGALHHLTSLRIGIPLYLSDRE